MVVVGQMEAWYMALVKPYDSTAEGLGGVWK